MPPWFDELNEFDSWQLHRVSAKSVGSLQLWKGDKDGGVRSKQEIDGIVALIKTGHCYRCRIGKGRWFYGRGAEEAAKAAVAAQPARVRIESLPGQQEMFA